MFTPAPSGSRIWKSSSTLLMSKGTCCSASHEIACRASDSFIRVISIFLMITSCPPTAVTTLEPDADTSSKRPRTASETSA